MPDHFCAACSAWIDPAPRVRCCEICGGAIEHWSEWLLVAPKVEPLRLREPEIAIASWSTPSPSGPRPLSITRADREITIDGGFRGLPQTFDSESAAETFILANYANWIDD